MALVCTILIFFYFFLLKTIARNYNTTAIKLHFISFQIQLLFDIIFVFTWCYTLFRFVLLLLLVDFIGFIEIELNFSINSHCYNICPYGVFITLFKTEEEGNAYAPNINGIYLEVLWEVQRSLTT